MDVEAKTTVRLDQGDIQTAVIEYIQRVRPDLDILPGKIEWFTPQEWNLTIVVSYRGAQSG